MQAGVSGRRLGGRLSPTKVGSAIYDLTAASLANASDPRQQGWGHAQRGALLQQAKSHNDYPRHPQRLPCLLSALKWVTAHADESKDAPYLGGQAMA